MGDLDLRPLHGLFQCIHPASHPDLPHPLLALAELVRKPPKKRQAGQAAAGSDLGEVEWVVALGGKGPEPADDANGAGGTGKKRRVPSLAPDEWWEARLCVREVAELMQQVDGAAITPEAMVGRVRARWVQGELDVKSYEGPGAEDRGGLELIIHITKTLPLSVVLSPCDHPPLSVLTILSKVIPAYLSCTADREACESAKAERDRLARQVERQERTNKDLQAQLDRERSRKRARQGSTETAPKRQNSGGSAFGHSASQESGRSQSGSFYEGGASQGSQTMLSPTKKFVPGQTHRGTLRPGDPGYAGNSKVAGRREAVDFDSVSEDSD
ncbi:hypothetical protein JCM10213_000358 [Rhodosporidiobolus nylandii]